MVDRFALAPGTRRARVLVFDLDADPFGEDAQRVGEADVLVFLHEGQHVAADAAAETLEETTIGMHVERGRLLAVKWTQADQIVAALAQRHVRTDHLADVGASEYLTLDAVVDTHGPQGSARGRTAPPQQRRVCDRGRWRNVR